MVARFVANPSDVLELDVLSGLLPPSSFSRSSDFFIPGNIDSIPDLACSDNRLNNFIIDWNPITRSPEAATPKAVFLISANAVPKSLTFKPTPDTTPTIVPNVSAVSAISLIPFSLFPSLNALIV